MEEDIIQGGSFLIDDIPPERVFTPEDFDEEQRLVAKSTEEFTQGEVLPKAD
ncbi:MAG: hypothetical protein GTO13_13405, partial [Proteobacteria bacterium]|nr:hypothetical protein [Pseudomonadota bacterium]